MAELEFEPKRQDPGACPHNACQVPSKSGVRPFIRAACFSGLGSSFTRCGCAVLLRGNPRRGGSGHRSSEGRQVAGSASSPARPPPTRPRERREAERGAVQRAAAGVCSRRPAAVTSGSNGLRRGAGARERGAPLGIRQGALSARHPGAERRSPAAWITFPPALAGGGGVEQRSLLIKKWLFFKWAPFFISFCPLPGPERGGKRH